MSDYAPALERLVGELAKLPGIGTRTAQRLAFHIMRSSDQEAFALAQAVRDVKERMGNCEQCFNLADGPRCGICLDPRRDQSMICVVEEPNDVISIERTRAYRGLYHVLGGAISPMDSIDPEKLKIAQLMDRVRASMQPGATAVTEVIMATNPTTSGEATALHIAEELRRLAPELALSRLASGLPVGADLEYADELTVGNALSGRRSI